MQKLILIDAFSQIFRGYYAVRALSNSKGEPTNALFAFARLMLQLEKEFPSEYGLMAFDCGKPAFRLELAPDYKANRPPMPEDLSAQLPGIHQLAAAFGWTECSRTNYEADDLIGAMAQNFPSYEILILSSDKDLAQLVNSHVTQLAPSNSGSWNRLDPDGVMAKFQLPPEQIVDYLALLGDASDNIAGVPGVGPKTAVKLLQEVTSLENFRQHPEQCSNVKLREKLLSNLALLDRNRKLITLKKALPEDFGSEPPLRKAPDWKAIRTLFERWELKSLLKQLPESIENKAVSMEDDLFADMFQ